MLRALCRKGLDICHGALLHLAVDARPRLSEDHVQEIPHTRIPERFGKKRDFAFQGCHDLFLAKAAGGENHAQARSIQHHPSSQIRTAQGAWHLNIREDATYSTVDREYSHRLIGGPGLHHGKAVGAQAMGQLKTDTEIVLDNEDRPPFIGDA